MKDRLRAKICGRAGGDGAGLGEEVAPGLAGGLDDGVVSLEHADAETPDAIRHPGVPRPCENWSTRAPFSWVSRRPRTS